MLTNFLQIHIKPLTSDYEVRSYVMSILEVNNAYACIYFLLLLDGCTLDLSTFLIMYHTWSNEVLKNLQVSFLNAMYWLSMMKNLHSPDLVGIGSWGPEIWQHEHLIRPIEISVNWPGS